MKENSGKQRFKNGKIHSSKFVTVLPKVTKTESIVGQRIWGMGSGQPVAYTQKKSIHVPPLLPPPPTSLARSRFSVKGSLGCLAGSNYK